MESQQRPDFIGKLLSTFHLNVIDRKVFIDKPITIVEVVTYIQNCLQDKAFFPEEASLLQDGESVYEGNFIEMVNSKEFNLHTQRHYPLKPYQVAEQKVKKYTSIDKIVRDYLEKEFEFKIDGLEIAK